MKFVLVLLLVLPLAFSAPEKRFVVDSIANLFNLDQIRALVGQLAHQLGGEPNEQSCEAVCNSIIAGETGLLHEACPFVCRSLQYLVAMFDPLPQDETTPALR